MSDEEDETFSSPEEGFSASEDEWKPTKEMQKGGESSDDDDSDFEDLPVSGGAGWNNSGAGNVKRREPKGRSAIKQQAVKKRKSTGQSLRSKLYNKYKPPPKTLPTRTDSNSPSASTSKIQNKASKNSKTPNDDSDDDENNSSSDSSVDDHLVNPAELDLRSSFFNVVNKTAVGSAEAVPQFDCNAGMNLSDSDSEDNETSGDEEKTNATSKAFDFRNLLEKASSLERVKETIAKRATASAEEKRKSLHEASAMDVGSLLALGENPTVNSETVEDADDAAKGGRQKLRQTKSTRQKRHTKTRPASTIMNAAGDSEDSDWEEVADDNSDAADGGAINDNENLEIHVEFPNKQRKPKSRDQQDLENALKRRINRDLKERQLCLHKASLLCFFARSYSYNRLLNDTTVMQDALKLLPSKNAYPPERGTEIKYYQSLVTWFKTTIKLKSDKLYADNNPKTKDKIKLLFREQFRKKEARCKQDMVCMFVILLRGMGLQCRLVVNMQPLPLKPSQSDLCTIKLKKDDKKDNDKSKNNEKEKDANKKNKNESDENKEKTKKSTDKKDNLNKSKEKEKAKSTTEKNDLLNTSSDKEQLQKNRNKYNKEDKVITSTISSDSKLKENVDKLRETKTTELSKNKANKVEKQRVDPSKEEKVNTNIGVNMKAVVETNSNKIKITNVTEENEFTRKDINHTEDKEKTVLRPTKKVQLTRLRQMQNSNEAVGIKKPKLNEGLPTPKARRTRLASSDKLPQQNTEKVTSLKRNKSPKSIIEIVLTTETTTTEAASGSVKSKQKNTKDTAEKAASSSNTARDKRSASKSPKTFVSPTFVQDNKVFKEKFSNNIGEQQKKAEQRRSNSKSPKDKNEKVKISTEFLKEPPPIKRTLRSRQKPSEQDTDTLKIPQLDGADDVDLDDVPLKYRRERQPKIKNLKKSHGKDDDDSDNEHFQPSPPKRPKVAPVLPKAVTQLRKDRRVLSTDDETNASSKQRNPNAADMWVEVWSDVEEQWICVDLFKGKLHSVDAIRKSASSSLAYVFAFQNDLSIKDVTARYCPHWTSTVRKARVEKAWIDEAISAYLGRRTKRDIREDQELRRIHEEKPMPTAISEYKDHPLYALERHLLKFQAIYPPNPPTLGFVRGEPVYARECVHTLHSREIWLKSARVVKLGEEPYKVVKARPKWDRITQTVIKDQPLEIFGYWQTQDYDPPTAENGIVPRNAYGNVELFKACMLPKKTVHLKLNGLSRICKKLGVDCANAVIGFDFHQGACHPLYDGFVICEEFEEAVTAAWHEDQENQARKEQEKYEARVYGNWKKLIRGLLIRERLKKKYNF